MTDRYFENFMREIYEETSTVDRDNERGEDLDKKSKDSLLKLLCKPDALWCKFGNAAIDLKEFIVAKTWLPTGEMIHNFTLYTGIAGTAFLLLKSYQVNGNRAKNDLNLSSEIIKECNSAPSANHSFLCGREGVCALGAVVAKNQENTQMVEYILFDPIQRGNMIDVKEHNNRDGLLEGRAGHLWACLFLNKHLGDGVIPISYTNGIVNKLIDHGRKLGRGTKCPLMFTRFGTKYWGAAEGLAGILYVLMHFDLTPDVQEDIKDTLKYMISKRFSSGNYPSKEDNREDVLVHWCNGALGMALTLVKAAEVFRDKEFTDAAIEAGEVVWKRGLLKRVGICHGISENAYVFLSLYRLTKNGEMLKRANVFACFLLDRAKRLISKRKMHGGDHPHSLFEGVGGMAYLFFDMKDPKNARFPGYEL